MHNKVLPLLPLLDGHSMPALGFGVWEVAEDQCAEVVGQALSSGYRLIDTASIYRNEAGVGRAVAQSGLPREELFITTKIWNSDQGRSNARDALQRSLERLQLSHVDLLLIHWPCPILNLYVETWETLIDLQQEGLVTSIGVSNFEPEHIEALVRNTGVRPVLNQIELHPQFQNTRCNTFNRQNAIITQAWGPLARGTAALQHPHILEMAQRHDKTPAQVVLRWHLQCGRSAIPKTNQPLRMVENFSVWDFHLSKEDMIILATLDTQQRLVAHPSTNPFIPPHMLKANSPTESGHI